MLEFENRVNEAIKNEPNSRLEQYTEEDICHLPPVVQKYMRYCGYLGTEKVDRAEIKWTDVYHKRNQKSKWMKLNYRQFNSACEPTRIVRIHAKLMGIIPLDIAEEYVENKGIWQIRPI